MPLPKVIHYHRFENRLKVKTYVARQIEVNPLPYKRSGQYFLTVTGIIPTWIIPKVHKLYIFHHVFLFKLFLHKYSWCIGRFGISHYLAFAWSLKRMRMHANAFFYLHAVFFRLHELAWHSNGSIKRQTFECHSNG